MIQVSEFIMENSDTEQPLVALISLGPYEEPASAEDAPLQEIFFEPPRLPGQSRAEAERSATVLSFRVDDNVLKERMKRTVRCVYTLYGSAGLDSLYEAILGNPKNRHTYDLKGNPPINTSYYDSLNQSPNRYKIGWQYQQERRVLEDEIEAAMLHVEATAFATARDRLGENRVEVIKEAQRYLDLGKGSEDAAIAALDNSRVPWSLTGYDIDSLANALLRIDEARRIVNQAEELSRRTAQPIIKQRADWMRGRIEQLNEEELKTPGIVHGITEEAMRRYPNTEAMDQAQAVVAERQAMLAEAIAVEAIEFPILYRMWNAVSPEAIRQILIAAQQGKRTLSRSKELRKAVLSTLATTWEASKNCLERIEHKDLAVWRYPPLIHEALRKLVIPPGSIEWKAADERIEAATTSILSKLSTVAGIVDIAVSAAFPPVAAATEVISLGLSMVEWIESALQAGEERDAFNSSLNPDKSFTNESSYVGLLVSLAFIVFSTSNSDMAGTVKSMARTPVRVP